MDNNNKVTLPKPQTFNLAYYDRYLIFSHVADSFLQTTCIALKIVAQGTPLVPMGLGALGFNPRIFGQGLEKRETTCFCGLVQ